MEAGMAKYFASEAAVENTLEAMRIHGGYGYSKEFNVERYYRDAPLMCIGEGTNEMQRIIIAKQLIETEPGVMRRRLPSLPLAGVRILAVEQYGAGPFGTHAPGRPGRRGDQDREAATRGGGDVARAVGPYFLGEATATSSSPSTATRAASRST